MNTVSGQSVFGDVKKKRPFGVRKQLILVLLALSIVLGSVIAFLQLRDNKSAIGVCDEKIIQPASKLLGVKDAQKLSLIAKDIRNKPKFEADINCMYIISVDSTNRYDLNRARKDINILEALYKANHSLHPALKTKEISVSDLRERIAFYEKQKDEMNQQVKTSREPLDESN